MTLWRKDKMPYGTYYAYENLKYIFPEANITINKSSPSKYAEFDPTAYATGNSSLKSKKAYVIISPRIIPDEQEINAMMNFVGDGNYIFMSSFYFGDSLLKSLNIKTPFESPYSFSKDTLEVTVKDPLNYSILPFEYPGNSYDSYASSLDSQYAIVLGTNADGKPDFLRFNYKSGGAIFVHFAPMTFTNFFLLHHHNKTYYDDVFSYLPQSVTEVKWDDYFRQPTRKNFSAFRFLLINPSFRWAFWLILLLFLILYLFESKRKQRMIPAIAPLRNSSVDFVKTVGRLYYQQRDNLNLANKMSAHFLGHVRAKYNLLTSTLDKDFEERLSYKSGYDKDFTKDIVDHIKVLQQQQSLSDEGLLQFNKKMEEFYKHT